jgi:hypothetical protein
VFTATTPCSTCPQPGQRAGSRASVPAAWSGSPERVARAGRGGQACRRVAPVVVTSPRAGGSASPLVVQRVRSRVNVPVAGSASPQPGQGHLSLSLVLGAVDKPGGRCTTRGRRAQGRRCSPSPQVVQGVRRLVSVMPGRSTWPRVVDVPQPGQRHAGLVDVAARVGRCGGGWSAWARRDRRRRVPGLGQAGISVGGGGRAYAVRLWLDLTSTLISRLSTRP